MRQAKSVPHGSVDAATTRGGHLYKSSTTRRHATSGVSEELVVSPQRRVLEGGRRSTDIAAYDYETGKQYESRRSAAKGAWRLWAKSIGEKEGTTDREADKIAMIRTAIVAVNIITCFFIIAVNAITISIFTS